MTEHTPPDHWDRHARRWQHVGPPLRPCPEDVALVEELSLGATGPALLLGVTPELATMRWPEGVELTALDRCPGMIRGVWPAEAVPGASVIRGNWTDMPLPAASCGLVVGDGCFTLLRYPDQQRRVLDQIRRVMDPAGRCVMRYFCRPEESEDLTAVFADMWRGRIGNFHILKWRLGMALHGSAEEGVSVQAMWERFDAEVPDRKALCEATGWSREAVDTMDVYRGSDAIYSFPTLAEMEALTDDLLEIVSLRYGSYEFAQRCPTVLYRPRGSTP